MSLVKTFLLFFYLVFNFGKRFGLGPFGFCACVCAAGSILRSATVPFPWTGKAVFPLWVSLRAGGSVVTNAVRAVCLGSTSVWA